MVASTMLAGSGIVATIMGGNQPGDIGVCTAELFVVTFVYVVTSVYEEKRSSSERQYPAPTH